MIDIITQTSPATCTVLCRSSYFSTLVLLTIIMYVVYINTNTRLSGLCRPLRISQRGLYLLLLSMFLFFNNFYCAVMSCFSVFRFTLPLAIISYFLSFPVCNTMHILFTCIYKEKKIEYTNLAFLCADHYITLIFMS